jgi:membrane protease YdiL (CAAX protease family)
MKKKQLILLSGFVLLLALLTLLTYLVVPVEQMLPAGIEAPTSALPGWVLGLANAGIILVVYGLVGLAGFWFAGRLDLPGVYRQRAGWRQWFGIPLMLGLLVGVLVVVIDQLLAAAANRQGFPHPQFPLSIFASATAGIGEEILFRSFVLGLWAFLANLTLRRWRATQAALWFGNAIAALAFSAGHLPSAMLLLGVTTPAAIPIPILLELFVVNSLMGLVAGERYMRQGLVAAIGIHFWADIVWHVIWPLVAIRI